MSDGHAPRDSVEGIDQDEAIRLYQSLCRVLALPRPERTPGRVLAELDRLLALRPYATHRPGCPEADGRGWSWERRCTCGYGAAARRGPTPTWRVR